MKKPNLLILAVVLIFTLACSLFTGAQTITPVAQPPAIPAITEALTSTEVPTSTEATASTEATVATEAPVSTEANIAIPLIITDATETPLPDLTQTTPLVATATQPPLPDLTRTFSEDPLITLKIPADWIIVHMSEGLFTICPSQQAQAQGNCLNIINDPTVSSVTELEKSVTRLADPGEIIKLKSKVTIGGSSGVLDETTGTLDGKPIHGLLAFVMDGSMGWTFSWYSPLDQFDWTEAMLMKILASVSFPAASAQPTQPSQTQPPFEAVAYTDPSGLFTLQVPKDWKVVNDSQAQTTSFCMDPKNVYSCLDLRLISQSAGLAQLTSQVLADLKTRTTAFEVSDQKQVTLSGVPATWVNLSYTYNGKALKGTLVFVVQNGIGLYFNGMELSSTYPNLNQLYFEPVIQSLHFKGG